ncbi:MAG: chemotaxis protein CheW [Desulfitobacteriaceae bacterium]
MAEEQFVAFQIGAENYAIPINYVKEIIRSTEITNVPQSKSYVKGIINLRGKVVTVVSLAQRLGISGTVTITDAQRIIIIEQGENVLGFQVDAVNEVLRIPENTIEPVPVNLQEGEYLMGVGKINGQLLLLLNAPVLFKSLFIRGGYKS